MAEPSLTIRPLEGHGLATIMARRDSTASAIGAALGVEAPEGARTLSANNRRRLIGTGPGTWLLLEESAGPGWATGIAHALTSLASVSDQSSGFALLEMKGSDARCLLQKGLAMDLHPEAFPVGSVATSVIEHIGVILWCVDAETFHVATFRSYAADFRHWLDETVKATSISREEIQ